MSSSNASNNFHRNKRAVSVIGTTAIVALLAVAIVYGVYTVNTSNARGSIQQGMQILQEEQPAATSSNQMITIYGNTSYTISGAQCGSATNPTGISFISSSGINYSVSTHIIATVPISGPGGYSNEISNYSINIPNNDEYKIQIILYSGNCPYTKQGTSTCFVGVMNLNANPTAKYELNVSCAANLATTTTYTITSSTVSATSSNNSTSTTYNTKVSTTCETP